MPGRHHLALPLVLFSLFALPDALVAEPAVRRIARVEHQPVNEMSGIVRSRMYEDVYWVHNDSGSGARLFALDGKGRPIFPAALAAAYHGEKPVKGRQPWPGIEVLGADNLDWEDIALADGMLYICDAGNNLNVRRDLGIYVLAEPNPRMVYRARILKFIPFEYPEQTEFPSEERKFDCEGLFVVDGTIYLLTKHRNALGMTVSGTRLYRLDDVDPYRKNRAVLIEEEGDLGIVTGACLSPSGDRLAVLTYTWLWIFERPVEGDCWLSSPARRLLLPSGETRQAEGVCWNTDEEILVTNEQRDVFAVSIDRFEDVE